MGCVFDPSTRVTSIVGIPMDWQPPATAEGCPLSAVSQTGGYREVGGPNGWLVMPADAAAWYVGGDYRYLLSFRLSPPPNPGQSVAAWAQPIDGGQAIPGEVAMNTRLERPAVAIAQSAQASGFYVTNLGFPRAGCWVVDMAINGDVVGSAVLAVGGRNPSPRPIPILP
jgi:hypothetical protein